MKNSNGTAGVVAIVVAALALAGVVAADQMMRHRAAKPLPPAVPTEVSAPETPQESAPADTFYLTPVDKGMPPPGEVLTI